MTTQLEPINQYKHTKANASNNQTNNIKNKHNQNRTIYDIMGTVDGSVLVNFFMDAKRGILILVGTQYKTANTDKNHYTL